MLELTQKSERTIQGLKLKVGKLEAEIANHHAGVEELNREHGTQVDELTEQSTLMEVGWCGLNKKTINIIDSSGGT